MKTTCNKSKTGCTNFNRKNPEINKDIKVLYQKTRLVKDELTQLVLLGGHLELRTREALGGAHTLQILFGSLLTIDVTPDILFKFKESLDILITESKRLSGLYNDWNKIKHLK